MKNMQIVFAGVLTAAFASFGEITIRSDYPGGNVKVCGIDEANGVVRFAPDLRDTKGKWFHWDFTLRGAAGRKLRFEVPDAKYEYLSSLGPAISNDGGRTWTWLHPDGTRHEPANAFEYTFGPDENETRFAVSIPYSQKDWDAFTAKWRKSPDVKFDVLCKSQSGRRDTELVRVPCRSKAKWLFVFTSRHHACETSASPVVEGVFEELMSGSPEAKWLRENADCLFVPFMDKDGVEEGDQGKNRRPHDHNRDYVAERYNSVKALKALVAKESQGKRFVFIDNHSPHVRSLPNGPEQDEIFSFGASDKQQNAVWNRFRRNWVETQKGGELNYDSNFDIKAGKGYDKKVAAECAKGLMTSCAWASSLPNCYLATCCEYGYSRCGGVYSFPAARELGGNMLKALVRTVQSSLSCAGKASDTSAAPVPFKDAAKIKSWDAWDDAGKTPTTWNFKEKRCVTLEKIRKMSSGLEPAGQLETRPAKAIRSNMWSVGCETLDRDYAYWNQDCRQ